MRVLTRHLPLPLATVILLTPVAGFFRAETRLDQARHAERRQRQLTEATVAGARPILVEIYRGHPTTLNAEAEHG